MNSLGKKIKKLRKRNNISQEVLAQYLGVSYQAVSKWENMATMPDITLLPAIATFFKISIDELFDYTSYSIENQALKICDEALVFRYSDPRRAKQILKDGLQRFPGNEDIMNHLLYVLSYLHENTETINMCKALIQSTKDIEVKYDSTRILVKTYYEMNEYRLALEYINQIPELYFTKQELLAKYSKGTESVNAAIDQKNQSLFIAIDMILELLKEKYDITVEEKANQLYMAEQLINLIEGDKLTPKSPIYDIEVVRNELERIKTQL